MPAHLWLDIALPELVADCCPAGIYALVFDREHRALKDPGTGVKVLTTYVKADHNDFAIVLSEHPQRTKYYFINLDESQFELPASLKGEEYTVEFWQRNLPGDYNRDQDILHEMRRLIWSGNEIVDAVLSVEDEDRLASYVAHISVAYDSETLTLYFGGHLERNGQLVTDTTLMNVVVKKMDGTLILNVNQNVYVSGSPGVFAWDIPSVDLDHDRVYLVECTITDANGATHNSISYLNAWD